MTVYLNTGMENNMLVKTATGQTYHADGYRVTVLLHRGWEYSGFESESYDYDTLEDAERYEPMIVNLLRWDCNYPFKVNINVRVEGKTVTPPIKTYKYGRYGERL